MNTLVKSELRAAMPFFLSFLTLFIGVITSPIILPENCSLFGNDEGPFMCHTIPNDCCGDKMTTLCAQIIFGLGVGLSVAAFIILWQKDSQNRNDNQLKIFN
ncbi:hypothetical protein BH24ACI1_BH24ACI1_06000 [soil metagenome]